MRKNIGMMLLAIWLVVTGLMGLLHFTFPYAGQVLAVIAVAAGILIIAGK